MSSLSSDQLNAAREILRAGDASPERVALRARSEIESYDLSYGELAELVRGFAGALSTAGIVEEQRVLIALPDVPELPIAFLGAIWAGTVPVLVNPALPAADYEFYLADTRAKLMVTTDALARGLTGAAGRLPAIWTVAPRRGGDFWGALNSTSERSAPFPSHPEDVAFWLYSSGTTGRPKGTLHLHESILRVNASYGGEILAISSDDVVYSTSRMFFAYGLGNSLYMPLAAGATAVLSPEPFDPGRTWRHLAEERPTLFFAVPSVYRALLDSADAKPEGLSRARICVSAGEALPPAIFEEWRQRFGQEILDGIGSTEMLHIYLSNRPGECRPGTLGTAVPGYELSLVDEDGRPVAGGEPGMMLVRGGSLAAGYWHRREATERAFRGEWYVSGDRGSCDAQGVYRVLGRSDDMLKIAGQWVSPGEVEDVIHTVAGVRECGVVGVPGTSGLTELVACVVTIAGATDVTEKIERACVERLARHKRPTRIQFLETLPRTATGKLQRFRLRETLGPRGG
ncbi:MAG: benzoate-CoA ligase family protein [Candidatus Binatia bacterium]